MKLFLKKTFNLFGGNSFLRIINPAPRVLFWHGVDHVEDPRVEAETLDTKIFIKQIKYLKNNFEIISINEFYRRYLDQNFTNKEIVLTFDDGYSNNLYHVAPILNNLSVPFTVFVSTEHIDSGKLFPSSIARLIILGGELKELSIMSMGIEDMNISTDEKKNEIYDEVLYWLKNKPIETVENITKELTQNVTKQKYEDLISKYKSVIPMNWEEVDKLSKMGATIGSHCMDHICCHKNQKIDIVEKQIKESKYVLESKLQYECNYFAYPNGDYTSESNSFIQEAGYLMGFSTEKIKSIKNSSNINIIPRIGVPKEFYTFKPFINIHPNQ